jgi:VCBS repeat-containing protein
MNAPSTRPTRVSAFTAPGAALALALGSMSFQAIAQSITDFQPHGGRGETVVLSGSGFTDAESVLFGGTPADSFTIDSDEQITATAPAGFTTGPITVDGVDSLYHYISRQNPMSLAGPVGDGTLPFGVLASSTGAPNDGSWGRPGGQTFFFQDMPLADRTWLYWSVLEGGVRLSMNGPDHNSPPGEIMGFSDSLSDLAQGRLVYTGVSTLVLAQPTWPQGSSLCTRFIMQFLSYNGSLPVPLVLAADAGLAEGIGAAAAVPPGYSFAVNVRFEAAYASNGCSVWMPALTLYDQAPTFPGTGAYSTFNRGFWYENTAPELGSIADVTVPDGGSTGALELMVDDAETGPEGVSLSADSSNTDMLPEANLVLDGSGAARTITATVVVGEQGSSLVTLTGSDAAGLSTQTSFTVVSTTQPIIAGLPPSVLVQLNQNSGAIEFTVIDGETAAGDLVLSGQSSNTVLVPNANISFGGSDSDRTVSVQPFLSQTGTSTITITATDGDGESGQASFEFRVNAPPVLTHNNAMSVDQGDSVVATNTNLRATDSESGATELTYRLNPDGAGSVPTYGELRLNGVALDDLDTFTQDDVDNGRLSYHHDDSCSAFDQFNFNVTDADGGITPLTPSLSFRADILVAFRNDPPVADDLVLQVGLGSSTTSTLPGSDGDCLTDDELTFALVPASGPQKGSITSFDPATGAFTYQAGEGEFGADEFQYEVSDGSFTETGRVEIEIGNLAPVVFDASLQTMERTPVSGSVTIVDPDLPPQLLNAFIVTNGSKGTAVIDDPETGSFTYTPAPGRVGADSFTIVVSDGIADSTPATVSIDIRGIVDLGDIVVPVRDQDPEDFVPIWRVLLIEPTSGDQYAVSEGVGNLDLRGIAADSEGNIFLVTGDDGLLHVAADTGAVTPLNDLAGSFPLGITFGPGGNLLVALGPGGIGLFNRYDGSRLGSIDGDLIEFASDVEVAPDGLMYVTDAGVFGGGSNKLLRIDPASAEQTLIATDFDFPASVALRSDGKVLVGDGIPAFGPMPSTLKVVDPEDGSIVTISDAQFNGLSGLDSAPTGEVYGINLGDARVFLLDSFGGPQTVLSGDGLLGGEGRFGLAVVKEVAILPLPDGIFSNGFEAVPD